MSDTTQTPNTPAVPDAPAAPDNAQQPTAPAPSITEAGAALRAAKSWDDVVQPEAPVEATPAAPESPADAPVEPEATETQPDPFDAFSLDDAGRLHRPDGTFASAEEVEAYNATATPEPTPETPAEPEGITVTLKDRNGQDVEIEVTDPKLADLIRANHNDGMRREEFNRRIATVEQKEAELREFETLVATNPDAVVFQYLPEDKRVSLTVKLVAQYWDQVYPQLVAFEQDNGQRVQTALQTKLDMQSQQGEYEQRVQAQRHAVQVMTAARALVPDGVSPEVEQAFLADAQSDLIRAAQAGQQVTPDAVKTLLQRRLDLYASLWGSSASVAAPEPPKRPVARPVARTVSAPAAASVPVPTGNAGATVRRTVTAQRVAAAVPPAGAGAATVNRSLVTSNDTIESASRKLKQLGNSWAPLTGG